MHGFASLSDTTICCVGPVAFRRRIARPLSPIFGSPLAPRCRGNGRMPRRPTPRQRVDPLAGTRDVPAPLTPPMGRTVYGEVCTDRPKVLARVSILGQHRPLLLLA